MGDEEKKEAVEKPEAVRFQEMLQKVTAEDHRIDNLSETLVSPQDIKDFCNQLEFIDPISLATLPTTENSVFIQLGRLGHLPRAPSGKHIYSAEPFLKQTNDGKSALYYMCKLERNDWIECLSSQVSKDIRSVYYPEHLQENQWKRTLLYHLSGIECEKYFDTLDLKKSFVVHPEILHRLVETRQYKILAFLFSTQKNRILWEEHLFNIDFSLLRHRSPNESLLGYQRRMKDQFALLIYSRLINVCRDKVLRLQFGRLNFFVDGIFVDGIWMENGMYFFEFLADLNAENKRKDALELQKEKEFTGIPLDSVCVDQQSLDINLENPFSFIDLLGDEKTNEDSKWAEMEKNLREYVKKFECDKRFVFYIDGILESPCLVLKPTCPRAQFVRAINLRKNKSYVHLGPSTVVRSIEVKGKKYAAKISELAPSSDPRALLKLLSKISRNRVTPGLIKVVDFFEMDITQIVVITPLYEYTLARYFKLSYQLNLELTFIYSKIEIGLMNLHKLGYLHRDIKADNIFIRDTKTGVEIAVGDFDSAIKLTSFDGYNVVGNDHYKSPMRLIPMFSNNRKIIRYGECSDFWSVSLMILEQKVSEIKRLPALKLKSIQRNDQTFENPNTVKGQIPDYLKPITNVMGGSSEFGRSTVCGLYTKVEWEKGVMQNLNHPKVHTKAKEGEKRMRALVTKEIGNTNLGLSEYASISDQVLIETFFGPPKLHWLGPKDEKALDFFNDNNKELETLLLLQDSVSKKILIEPVTLNNQIRSRSEDDPKYYVKLTHSIITPGFVTLRRFIECNPSLWMKKKETLFESGLEALDALHRKGFYHGKLNPFCLYVKIVDQNTVALKIGGCYNCGFSGCSRRRTKESRKSVRSDSVHSYGPPPIFFGSNSYPWTFLDKWTLGRIFAELLGIRFPGLYNSMDPLVPEDNFVQAYFSNEEAVKNSFNHCLHQVEMMKFSCRNVCWKNKLLEVMDPERYEEKKVEGIEHKENDIEEQNTLLSPQDVAGYVLGNFDPIVKLISNVQSVNGMDCDLQSGYIHECPLTWEDCKDENNFTSSYISKKCSVITDHKDDTNKDNTLVDLCCEHLTTEISIEYTAYMDWMCYNFPDYHNNVQQLRDLEFRFKPSVFGGIPYLFIVDKVLMLKFFAKAKCGIPTELGRNDEGVVPSFSTWYRHADEKEKHKHPELLLKRDPACYLLGLKKTRYIGYHPSDVEGWRNLLRQIGDNVAALSNAIKNKSPHPITIRFVEERKLNEEINIRLKEMKKHLEIKEDKGLKCINKLLKNLGQYIEFEERSMYEDLNVLVEVKFLVNQLDEVIHNEIEALLKLIEEEKELKDALKLFGEDTKIIGEIKVLLEQVDQAIQIKEYLAQDRTIFEKPEIKKEIDLILSKNNVNRDEANKLNKILESTITQATKAALEKSEKLQWKLKFWRMPTEALTVVYKYEEPYKDKYKEFKKATEVLRVEHANSLASNALIRYICYVPKKSNQWYKQKNLTHVQIVKRFNTPFDEDFSFDEESSIDEEDFPSVSSDEEPTSDAEDTRIDHEAMDVVLFFQERIVDLLDKKELKATFYKLSDSIRKIVIEVYPPDPPASNES